MRKMEKKRAGRIGLLTTTVTATLLFPHGAAAQCELDNIAAAGLTFEDQFGLTIAMSGDTAVIGAPFDDEVAGNAGAVYVYERMAGVWTESLKLTASDGTSADEFGTGLAIDGDTILVGAPDALGHGAVYVFTRDGAGWMEQQILTSLDAAGNDDFGEAIAMRGDTAVIGAPSQDGVGAIYVFNRGGSVWSEQIKRTGSNVAFQDEVGISVVLDQTHAYVGARRDNDIVFASGAVYVFEQSAGWPEVATLKPPAPAPDSRFGHSIAVEGDVLLVGANEDSTNGFRSGSAHVFRRTGGVWGYEKKLAVGGLQPGDALGEDVALAAGVAYVGRPYFDLTGSIGGAIHVFPETGGTWSPDPMITVSGAGVVDAFLGWSLAAHGDTLMSGAVRDHTNVTDSGSVYVFGGVDRQDCDGNGALDTCEIAGNPELDANGDGVLDACGNPADIDGNGSVGFTDLTIILGGWGPCPAPCPPSCSGDIDGDCNVGFTDLTIVLGAWGR